MDRRQNMLIGIVVGIVVVAASAYATGLTKLLLSPFHSSAEYKSSESAAAPELAPGDWINSEPLRLKDLRGRVVLIEFWTFGCYNCRNTLPFVKSWDDRYRANGLTVIGVHSPEFDDERKAEKEDPRRDLTEHDVRIEILFCGIWIIWFSAKECSTLLQDGCKVSETSANTFTRTEALCQTTIPNRVRQILPAASFF